MLFKKTKKLPVLQLAASLLIAAFAVILGACPGLDSPSEQYKPNTNPDFIITGTGTHPYNGEPREVEVKAKNGLIPQEKITVYYKKAGEIEKDTEAPSDVGNYAVSFDVAESPGFSAKTDQSAPDPLVIDPYVPKVEDYDITGLKATYNGQPKPVSILRNNGFTSPGDVKPHYEGTGGTTYAKSPAAPSAVGVYIVTFDVAESQCGNFSAAPNLSAGTLEIEEDPYVPRDPMASDFTIGPWNETYDGNTKPVSITPKDENSSQGAITIHYKALDGATYTSPDAPSNAGCYTVTFDVAVSTGFYAKNGLSAGTLTVDPAVPARRDFTIRGRRATYEEGVRKEVTITPKTGKSQGVITRYYEGIDGTTYAKRQAAPTNVGRYAVTFYVAQATNYYEATLSAGTLVISAPVPVPVAEDYTITGLAATYDGNSKPVTITPNLGSSEGARTIYYKAPNGTILFTSPDAPSEVGSYAVTFDVEAWEGFGAASGLSAGTLVISPLKTPTADDYTYGGFTVTANDSPQTVSITRKASASPGSITDIWYEGIPASAYTKTTAGPSAAGSYKVTFDVAAAEGYTSATGLEAPEPLRINPAPVLGSEINYESGPDALSWGTTQQASVLTLGLQPGNDTTEIRLNWYSSGSTTNKVAQVRFVKGTFTAATQLITTTGTASSAGGSTYTAHKAAISGLTPGESYQYAVSSDGTNWSARHNFKVPAANGTFRFAAISDPQLSTGNQQGVGSSYTTAAGWATSMEKIVAANASFVASCGDITDYASEAEYERFFAPSGLRNLPFSPVSGNHDTGSTYDYHFNWPTNTGSNGRNYYYRYNNILFVVLNTGTGGNTTQVINTTFNNVIIAAKEAHEGKYDWLVVQHHVSTTSVGTHGGSDAVTFRTNGFEKLMSDHNVDFVFSGHDHVYTRSYPLLGKAGSGANSSVPQREGFPAAPGSTWNNPGHPIYFTFTTASGLKYYAVSSNTSGNYIPNAAYAQANIPGYTIVDVNGKTITFKTYPIYTGSGSLSAWSGNGYTPMGNDFSYDFNRPYDEITITKN